LFKIFVAYRCGLYSREGSRLDSVGDGVLSRSGQRKGEGDVSSVAYVRPLVLFRLSDCEDVAQRSTVDGVVSVSGGGEGVPTSSAAVSAVSAAAAPLPLT